MTAERMGLAKGHRWLGFWRNLKEGHDAFERTRIPPDASVRGQRYEFTPDLKSGR